MYIFFLKERTYFKFYKLSMKYKYMHDEDRKICYCFYIAEYGNYATFIVRN